MKLVNKKFGLELDFIENQVLNLLIESPEYFSEVVYSICRQVKGEEGEFILSNIEKELSFEKKVEIIINPLSVSCDEKRIINQIYKSLSDNINGDFFEGFATVNQNIVQFMDLIIDSSEYNLSLSVDFKALELIKYCNIHMESQYDSLAEKLIDYLRALKMICHLEVVFILNLKQYFSKIELEEIYKYCFYNKIYLVNLEGKMTIPIKRDRYVIIDKDLCILDFSY